MTDVIELLRAHDPERAGTAAPPIEPLLARLAEEPAPRGRRRPRRQRPHRRGRVAVAVALACLALIALVAIALGGGGGSDRDALVPADEAVAPGSVIVHTISRTTMNFGRGRRGGATMQDVGTMDGPVERWGTASLSRWRIVATLLPGRGLPGGSSEQAYADGVMRTRTSWRRGVDVRRVPDLAGSIGIPTADADVQALTMGVADPRVEIRSLVDRGVLRDEGTTTRDGRELLRFVAEREGRRMRGNRSNGIVPASRVELLVDAQTYDPVEAVRAMRMMPRDPARRRFVEQSRTVFDAYENLPLTSETAPLLRLGGRTR